MARKAPQAAPACARWVAMQASKRNVVQVVRPSHFGLDRRSGKLIPLKPNENPAHTTPAVAKIVTDCRTEYRSADDARDVACIANHAKAWQAPVIMWYRYTRS